MNLDEEYKSWKIPTLFDWVPAALVILLFAVTGLMIAGGAVHFNSKLVSWYQGYRINQIIEELDRLIPDDPVDARAGHESHSPPSMPPEWDSRPPVVVVLDCGTKVACKIPYIRRVPNPNL